MAATACGKDEAKRQAPAQPSAARPEQTQPASGATRFRIALPAPEADGPSATLTIGLTGEFLASAHGADDVTVEGGEAVPGRKRAYRLRAHARELQRLRIGGTTVLVRVPPDAEIRLADQPCFGWELIAPWLEAGLHITRPGEGGTCPPGTSKQLEDYRCPAGASADGYCCHRTSAISFAGSADRLRAIEGPGGGVVELGPGDAIDIVSGGCGFHSAKSASETVGLAIGYGKSWHIDIDDRGRVSGRLLYMSQH